MAKQKKRFSRFTDDLLSESNLLYSCMLTFMSSWLLRAAPEADHSGLATAHTAD
jgi:hypothetical protein